MLTSSQQVRVIGEEVESRVVTVPAGYFTVHFAVGQVVGTKVIDKDGKEIPFLRSVKVEHVVGDVPTLMMEFFCCEANDHILNAPTDDDPYEGAARDHD